MLRTTSASTNHGHPHPCRVPEACTAYGALPYGQVLGVSFRAEPGLPRITMGLLAHIPSRQRGKAHCLEALPRSQCARVERFTWPAFATVILEQSLMLLVISVQVGTSNIQGGRILQLALLPRVDMRGAHNENSLKRERRFRSNCWSHILR